MTRHVPLVTALLTTAMLFVGCVQDEPDESAASETTSAPNAQQPAADSAPASQQPGQTEQPEQTEGDPTVAQFLGLKAPKPATWQWRPPSNNMITTNYTVPGIDDSKAAHVNVYFFGEGQGGPIEDNVERWKNQFRSDDGYEVEPQVETFEVNDMPVTFVELEGEWRQMGTAWYTPEQLFLAAIVDAPVGRIFIRFGGDAATVEHNREPFMAMINGLQPVNDAADGAATSTETDDGSEY